MATIEELEKQLLEHRVDYERRHAVIESRLTRMETIIEQLPTHDDFSAFQSSVAVLEETVKKFETIAQAMVTKTDVAWLKRWYWLLAGAIVMTGLGLAAHVAFQMRIP